MIIRFILCIILTLTFATPVSAGETDDCRDVTISLLTARAGADIYQLEGHTALRIQHPLRGDYVVNWGLFDFSSPNFVYRFVKGETDYMAGAAATEHFLRIYEREGRAVVEQTLNLTPEQKCRIVELTDINLQPANRVYRYNYVLDNCATRPLAIIEKAIGDTLRLCQPQLPAEATETFRSAMTHYHSNYPWYQFGIDLALGSGIDRKISSREMSFAPEALEQMLTDATLPDGSKAVSGTTTLTGSTDTSAIDGPTPWYLAPRFWVFAVLILSLSLSDSQWRRRSKSPGIVAKIFDTIFFSLMGLAGCVIVFLIFISVHEATSPNWLLLWLNPLCFIGAVAVWSKRLEKLLVCYQIVNFALLILLLIIFGFSIQVPNPAFIPLIMADGVRALAYIVTYNKKNR